MRESWQSGRCIAVLCVLNLAWLATASTSGYDTKQSPQRTCPRARFPARNYVYRVPADRFVPLKTHLYAAGILALETQGHRELEFTHILESAGWTGVHCQAKPETETNCAACGTSLQPSTRPSRQIWTML